MTIANKRPTKTVFDAPLLTRFKVKEKLGDLLPPLVAIAIFLTIWQLFSWIPGATLPGPIRVVKETWVLILYPFYDKGDTDKGLFWQVFASLQRVAIGYTFAAIVGVGVGILVGLNKLLSKALDPIFQLLRTVPPLAWVPIALEALQKNQPASLSSLQQYGPF
jgi:bicarbonate transport system permease protein